MGRDNGRKDSRERRAVLKTLGFSPLALLFAEEARGAVDDHGGAPALSHQDWELTQDLAVSNVEPGWKRADGGWDPADTAMDMGTGFDVTMHVDGVEQSGSTSLAYLVALAGPDEGFAAVHGGNAVNPPSGGEAQITHGSPVTRGFQPEPGSVRWSEGRYRICALVIDRARGAYGGGRSPPFEIS